MMSVPTIAEMRDAAALDVSRSSLRSVALAIRISPTGLKKMLQGTSPYSPTRKRLRAWYAARPAHRVAPAPEVVAAAMNVLVHGLPPEIQTRARIEMGRCLEAAYGTPFFAASTAGASPLPVPRLDGRGHDGPSARAA